MKYILFLIVILFSNQAVALNCEKQPTCAELGYSTEDNQNCFSDGYLICPFDSNYKKCVNFNCESLGFTQSDKSSWCASLITCKSNPSMTLCQKPCFATDYASLKELTESGDCKIVTVRNDIEIPKNKSLTLADNTTLDGNGHTLNSSGDKGFNVYNLNNNSGFKNIFIKHKQSQTQEDLKVFVILHDTYKATLQDTQIQVQSDDSENHSCLLFHYGTYEISGKFTADIQPKKHYALSDATIVFKDADINVSTEGLSSDAFSGKTDFINSHGTVTTGGFSVVYDETLTLKNSKIHLNAPSQGIFWGWSHAKFGTIHLKDNAELTLTFNNLIGGTATSTDNLAHIKFESSSSAPAKLIIEGKGELQGADVTANNMANMLVLNGTTYRPKQIGTTLLSEIPNSPIWEVVQ